MSSIYIQEPPTSGKVLLHTTVGDIDIEIWSKETPKACRNFVQLCMEGYYDATPFHRLVKGFIVQGGDPTGTGMGGESIYGKPFKDEFHTRLRFVRRGLVAMANAGKDDNASQFFFTLDACPELINKHTIFGKVTGNTLYNMLKLEESLTDQNERPLYPHKIITTKVINNPFPDIVPRVVKKSGKDKSEVDDKKNATKGTKNFSLLSFGEEAEEEEAETDAVVKGYRGKSKSSHDLTNDPKLSSVPAVESSMAKEIQGDLIEEKPKGRKRSKDSDEDEEAEMDEEEKQLQEEKRKLEKELTLTNIKKKLKKEEKSEKSIPEMSKADRYYQEKNDTEEKKREEVRREIKKIKRELSDKKKEPEKAKDNGEDEDEETEEEKRNNLLAKYHQDKKKYKEMKKKLSKGAEREQQTLAILAKFTTKLLTAKEKDDKDDDAKKEIVLSDEEDEGAWLTHQLSFEEQGTTQAKDANIKTAESYDISDPRNPMNMRRREKGKQNSSSSSRSGKKH